jgi:hypothetical protein
MRTLGVIALSGVRVSVICLALAHAIDPGVSTLNTRGFWFRGCAAPAENSPDATEELAWNGDGTVTINVPAVVHYQPGSGDTVRATGPEELTSHLRVRDGRIELDCNFSGSDRKIDLVLPGRAFDTFTLNGTGRLMLENLKQDRLNVSLRGEGDVRATGVADDLTLNIAGSGDGIRRKCGSPAAAGPRWLRRTVRISSSPVPARFASSNSRAICRPISPDRAASSTRQPRGCKKTCVIPGRARSARGRGPIRLRSYGATADMSARACLAEAISEGRSAAKKCISALT